MNWKHDIDKELVCDGTENEKLKSILQSYINSDYNSSSSLFKNLRKEMREEYHERLLLPGGKGYKTPPPSIKIVKTKRFVDRDEIKFPQHIY